MLLRGSQESTVGTKATCDALGTDCYSGPGFTSLNWKYYSYFGTDKEPDEKVARWQKLGYLIHSSGREHLKPTEETFLSYVVNLRNLKTHSHGRNQGSLGSITSVANSVVLERFFFFHLIGSGQSFLYYSLNVCVHISRWRSFMGFFFFSCYCMYLQFY